MSVTTHNTQFGTRSRGMGLGEILKRAIWGIRSGLEAERLLKMSDHELASHGLRRDDIVNRAFPRFISA